MKRKPVERDTKLRVAVCGSRGRMGQESCQAIKGDKDLTLAAVIDPMFTADYLARRSSEGRYRALEEALEAGGIDVVLDFTVPDAVRQNVLTCIRYGVPVVVGTTGLSAADLTDVERQAVEKGTAVLVAPNFSMGAVMMMRFAESAAEHFHACEIVELHHDEKLDAPSGTSRLSRLRIEKAWRDRGLDKELPIHSVRLPGLVAHQMVIFGGLGETLTIKHDSMSRASFMPGVLLAVKRVRSLQGLVVGLENIL